MVNFMQLLPRHLQVHVVTLSHPRFNYLQSANLFSHHPNLQLVFFALNVLVKQSEQQKKQVPLGLFLI